MNATTYSECTGIHWDNNRCKWFAKIHINGRSLFLGRFKNESDAVEAREKAEAAISLLRDLDAINIHISTAKNDKVLAGILSEKSFKFKFEIQLDLPRIRDYNPAGDKQ